MMRQKTVILLFFYKVICKYVVSDFIEENWEAYACIKFGQEECVVFRPENCVVFGRWECVVPSPLCFCSVDSTGS